MMDLEVPNLFTHDWKIPGPHEYGGGGGKCTRCSASLADMRSPHSELCPVKASDAIRHVHHQIDQLEQMVLNLKTVVHGSLEILLPPQKGDDS